MRNTSKRTKWSLLAVLLLMFTLTGCNQYGNLNESEIESITVSKVGEDWKDIKDPHATYSQKDTKALEAIAEAINQAEKVEGKGDVTFPDYYVIVNYQDETNDEDTVKYYSFWLSDEHASMMDMKDTNTIYTVPSSMVDELNEYIK